MPDIDGLTVLRQIRDIRPDATVFIFTGSDNPEAERQARKLGVTEFLQKGFALPTLSEIEARAQGSAKPAPDPSAGSSWWKLKM
jgi:DNA-binding NtrC family response regulator